jgi:hypothetical protein
MHPSYLLNNSILPKKKESEIGNNTAHHSNAGWKKRKLMQALTEQTKWNTN